MRPSRSRAFVVGARWRTSVGSRSVEGETVAIDIDRPTPPTVTKGAVR
jgi:hypothetical protein